jgi:hypothetical protein
MLQNTSERFINLTPHMISVFSTGGVAYEFPSEGVAHVDDTELQVVRVHAGVEIRQTQYGEVAGLPEPREGVVYIVSPMVRKRLPQRTDLASPDLRESSQCENIKGTRPIHSPWLEIQRRFTRRGIEFA